MKPPLPAEELMTPGHLACQGCGAALAMRCALKGLGPKTVAVIPACCWTIIAGQGSRSSLGVPILHAAFAAAAATASGVKAGLAARGNDETVVMAWAGDGGTFDIGIQSFSGAADRGDDILYVCYDNEAYMNTGIQRSSATPASAWTMTSPAGSDRPKKDLDAIAAAHRIPYQATATPAYAEDMVRKFQKAREIKGFKFIHVLAPCPPGWKYDAADTVKLSRLAVQTGLFPIFEIERGAFRLNVPVARRKPVAEFLCGQSRFSKLTEAQTADIQRQVDERWARLEKGGSCV